VGGPRYDAVLCFDLWLLEWEGNSTCMKGGGVASACAGRDSRQDEQTSRGQFWLLVMGARETF